MRWLSYSLVAIFTILLVLFQAAFLPALGMVGAVLHPVLWGVFFINFFMNGKYIWVYVIIGALLLDIIDGKFGLNIISLSFVTFVLIMLHQYHFALRNSLGWMLTSFVGLCVYIFSVFVLTNTIGIVWNWYYLIDLSWQMILFFFITNLVALLGVFFIHSLFQKFVYARR
jgi:hypothetical protein